MNPTTDSWLNALPPELAAHAAALRRLTAAVEADPRLRALEVTGSVGRGTGDANSDLDVIIATHDALWPAMTQEIPELAQALGGIVDLVAFPLTKFEKRAILVRKRVNSVGWGAPGFRRPSAIFPEVSQRLHCPNHSIFPA